MYKANALPLYYLSRTPAEILISLPMFCFRSFMYSLFKMRENMNEVSWVLPGKSTGTGLSFSSRVAKGK